MGGVYTVMGGHYAAANQDAVQTPELLLRRFNGKRC